MQNDPTAVGASDSDRPDLVDVTLQDGKYRVRQVVGGGWECLVDGEVRHSFSVLPAGDFVSALATRVAELEDLNAEMGDKLADLLHIAEKTLEFFEPHTDPQDMPREYAAIQRLRGAVDRVHGDSLPTSSLMYFVLEAVKKNGFKREELFRTAFERLPADHDARRISNFRMKCCDCLSINLLSDCLVGVPDGNVSCPACDSEEELIMLKPGEV